MVNTRKKKSDKEMMDSFYKSMGTLRDYDKKPIKVTFTELFKLLKKHYK